MEQDFTIEEIIDLMKKTKKTDPLFKPLKKLKTAMESIGINNISLDVTNRVIVFHFGLGNDLDKEFIKLTQVDQLNRNIEIIPGHAYCVLQFVSAEAAAHYIASKTSIHQRSVYYKEVNYQNLSRTLIFLYCKEEFLKEKELFAVPNCQSKFIPASIPGLIVVEDIISKEEQVELLNDIDNGKWEKLNNRRVQHYGYQFKYGRNQIDKDQQQGQLPKYFNKLLDKLKTLEMLKNMDFDQLTINDYFAGNGIPSHFDTHSPFEEVFIAISLLSGLVMDFKKYDGEEQFVYLRERSLTIFSGEARYAWIHGISCRKVDKVDNQILYRSRRLSLTFRKIKFSPCTCPYYFYCDSQGYDQQTMKKNNPLLTKYLSEQHKKQLAKYSPAEIQRQFVDKAYNGFGFDFHNKVIDEIKVYMQKQIVEGDIVLDIGCGNGEYNKYVNRGAYYIGIEKCTVMIPVENQFHMDCLKLQFKSNSFDKILFVAVLHHLASEQSRIAALKQVWRVLRVGGILYLSVLSYEHKKDVYSSPQTFLQYCLPANKLPQKTNFLTEKEVQIPRIQQRGEVYSRYYHLFLMKELEYLLKASNFHIIQINCSKENIIVKAIKQQQ